MHPLCIWHTHWSSHASEDLRLLGGIIRFSDSEPFRLSSKQRIDLSCVRRNGICPKGNKGTKGTKGAKKAPKAGGLFLFTTFTVGTGTLRSQRHQIIFQALARRKSISTVGEWAFFCLTPLRYTPYTALNEVSVEQDSIRACKGVNSACQACHQDQWVIGDGVSRAARSDTAAALRPAQARSTHASRTLGLARSDDRPTCGCTGGRHMQPLVDDTRTRMLSRTLDVRPPPPPKIIPYTCYVLPSFVQYMHMYCTAYI